MKEETEKLLKERNDNEQIIIRLKNKSRDLISEKWKIEGFCPHCKNWHYPHCGMDI